MNPLIPIAIKEVVNLGKKVIPMMFNDDDKTKFDLSALLNLVAVAALVYYFGADTAEVIIELAGDVE